MADCLIGTCAAGQITGVSQIVKGGDLNKKFLPTSTQSIESGQVVAKITKMATDISKGNGNGI